MIDILYLKEFNKINKKYQLLCLLVYCGKYEGLSGGLETASYCMIMDAIPEIMPYRQNSAALTARPARYEVRGSESGLRR